MGWVLTSFAYFFGSVSVLLFAEASYNMVWDLAGAIRDKEDQTDNDKAVIYLFAYLYAGWGSIATIGLRCNGTKDTMDKIKKAILEVCGCGSGSSPQSGKSENPCNGVLRFFGKILFLGICVFASIGDAYLNYLAGEDRGDGYAWFFLIDNLVVTTSLLYYGSFMAAVELITNVTKMRKYPMVVIRSVFMIALSVWAKSFNVWIAKLAFEELDPDRNFPKWSVHLIGWLNCILYGILYAAYDVKSIMAEYDRRSVTATSIHVISATKIASTTTTTATTMVSSVNDEASPLLSPQSTDDKPDDKPWKKIKLSNGQIRFAIFLMVGLEIVFNYLAFDAVFLPMIQRKHDKGRDGWVIWLIFYTASSITAHIYFAWVTIYTELIDFAQQIIYRWQQRNVNNNNNNNNNNSNVR